MIRININDKIVQGYRERAAIGEGNRDKRGVDRQKRVSGVEDEDGEAITLSEHCRDERTARNRREQQRVTIVTDDLGKQT